MVVIIHPPPEPKHFAPRRVRLQFPFLQVPSINFLSFQ